MVNAPLDPHRPSGAPTPGRDPNRSPPHSYRGGIDVDALATRSSPTRTAAPLARNGGRGRGLPEQSPDYICHASFDDPALEAIILAPMPDEDKYEARRREMNAPRDVPPE